MKEALDENQGIELAVWDPKNHFRDSSLKDFMHFNPNLDLAHESITFTADGTLVFRGGVFDPEIVEGFSDSPRGLRLRLADSLDVKRVRFENVRFVVNSYAGSPLYSYGFFESEFEGCTFDTSKGLMSRPKVFRKCNFRHIIGQYEASPGVDPGIKFEDCRFLAGGFIGNVRLSIEQAMALMSNPSFTANEVILDRVYISGNPKLSEILNLLNCVSFEPRGKSQKEKISFPDLRELDFTNENYPRFAWPVVRSLAGQIQLVRGIKGDSEVTEESTGLNVGAIKRWVDCDFAHPLGESLVGVTFERCKFRACPASIKVGEREGDGLSLCKFHDVEFIGVDFSGFDFQKAEFKNCLFWGCELGKAKLRRCDLDSGTQFLECKFGGDVFGKTTWPEKFVPKIIERHPRAGGLTDGEQIAPEGGMSFADGGPEGGLGRELPHGESVRTAMRRRFSGWFGRR